MDQQPVRFEWDFVQYQIRGWSDGQAIVLPCGTVLRSRGVSESIPPQPRELYEVADTPNTGLMLQEIADKVGGGVIAKRI